MVYQEMNRMYVQFPPPFSNRSWRIFNVACGAKCTLCKIPNFSVASTVNPNYSAQAASMNAPNGILWTCVEFWLSGFITASCRLSLDLREVCFMAYRQQGDWRLHPRMEVPNKGGATNNSGMDFRQLLVGFLVSVFLVLFNPDISTRDVNLARNSPAAL